MASLAHLSAANEGNAHRLVEREKLSVRIVERLERNGKKGGWGNDREIEGEIEVS